MSEAMCHRLIESRIRGANVVLTGASSGIGRATARALAERGAVLHLWARREGLLQEVCAEVYDLGGSAVPYVVDVRDEMQVRSTAARVCASSGPVDILINNAGVGAVKSFEGTSDDDWKWTLDTNLFSIIYAVRAFVPGMLERGQGTIVNVASLAGLIGNPLAAYTASKFAVVGLSESLMIEYGGRGVGVVVVCPGVVDTDIAEAAALAGRSSPDMEVKMRNFMSRFGASPSTVAADIAAAIERRTFLVLSPRHASVLRAIHRLFPESMRRAFRNFGN